MPISTPGSGTPRMPMIPPNAITSGKTIGNSQIAGDPRNAPQRPTATIATTWSGPNSGCAKPPTKPPLALPVCAKAGAHAIARSKTAIGMAMARGCCLVMIDCLAFRRLLPAARVRPGYAE